MCLSPKVPLWVESNWNGFYFSFLSPSHYWCMLQYWGWCKYRYREVQKTTFKEAKLCTRAQLDACPTEVIRWFINRLWWFMSAYQMDLTGKAAEWAVRKQKQHRQVSHAVMMSIDAVLNGTWMLFFWAKNLAAPKRRGRNSGGLFFDVFWPSKFKSGLSFP